MNARATPTEEEMFAQPSEVAMLRIPPHSIEAESGVLGALLLDGGGATWDRVADILTADDFYRFEHRQIFDAIAMLANANRAADVVTVHAKLQGMKDAGDIGLMYLNDLAQYVPSASHIRRHAELVREKSMLRRLVSVGDEIATKAFNPGLQTVAEAMPGFGIGVGHGLDEVGHECFLSGRWTCSNLPRDRDRWVHTN